MIVDNEEAILTLLRELKQSVAAQTQMIAALADRLDRPGHNGSRDPRPLINWVIGPPDNASWAYGNNAKRLAANLPAYRHAISTKEPSAVAVYFDVLVAQRFPVYAEHSIVRLGGPRPLDRLFGDDVGKLRQGLEGFDAVIALNLALFNRVIGAHRNVHLIPNGLDLRQWRPSRRSERTNSAFTVGFAASLTSAAEAETKGYEIARSAAALAGADFISCEKSNGKQISHDRMLADFYSQCDVLAHPVGPGREGSSNVVMESLAAGVPVITTVDAGLHGETFTDNKTALIRERSAEAFAEAMVLLRDDDHLKNLLTTRGVDYARYMHDIARRAGQYGAILDGLTKPAKPEERGPSVCFVPFWTPEMNFASSRLRALYPSQSLARDGYGGAGLGYRADADVAIVVQSCDIDVWEQLAANPEQFVIYDVCDRYFENEREFARPSGTVNSLHRYHQLVDRADLIIVPTLELKAEVAARATSKPVVFVPEPLDYHPPARMLQPETNRCVLWFGNPDRGNFESVQWMIEALRDQYGYEPLIVSRPSFFSKHPEIQPFVVPWSPEAMTQAFARSAVCVVAHSPSEQTKSPNRFITAIMHGVPTLVSNSPACEQILVENDMTFAIVNGPASLDKAMEKLADPLKRKPFVEKLQRALREAYGEEATAGRYRTLLERLTFRKRGKEPLNVALVSHNLALGEGAPRSLLEIASGLRRFSDIEPRVYSAGSGPLADAYQTAGMPIEIFDPTLNHCVKVLNQRFTEQRRHFLAFLAEHKIDVVIANTVKASPYIDFADSVGIPSILIVRESFSADERFSAFTAEARFAAESGFAAARKVVFVSHESRRAWLDRPIPGGVHVIQNGASEERFAPALAATKAEARASIGMPEGDVLALCVGTINQRKGQAELLQAFAGLPEKVRNRSRLVFLGAVENAHLADFEMLHAALPAKIRSRVEVRRATEDVGPYLRAADVFLMNSSSEAYPRSVIEALLFGLPVLSTKVFGVREQIQHDRNGLLYEIGAMGDWAKHFTRFVTNDADRARIGADAARSFYRLASYSEMLHAYRCLLHEVAASRSPAERPSPVAAPQGVHHT